MPPRPAHDLPVPAEWNAERFFQLLRDLSPLRVISVCGPSTFEAICDFDAHGMAHGHMNAMTPAYHWHFRLNGLRFVKSCDEVHTRSGRRVLFLELRADPESPPFLWIYVHREKGAEFDAEREVAFAAIHPMLEDGIVFEGELS